MTKSCINCDHRVYDGRWGGPMCRKYQHKVRDVDRYLDCPGHTTQNKKEDEKK